MNYFPSPMRNSADPQRGAALLVALVMLLITAMLGVAAMKTSMFSSKIATASQVDAMSFEAAESALNVAFADINNGTGPVGLVDMMTGALYQRCLTKGDLAKAGACGGNDRFDDRSLIKAWGEAAVRGMHPISGTQISTTGGSGIFVDYEVGLLGQAEVEDFGGIYNYHAQEALRRGIRPGSDVVEE